MKDNDTVYTTGAYLQRIFVAELGEYRWIVTGFEDDTYYDGNYIDLNIAATNLNDMIRNEGE